MTKQDLLNMAYKILEESRMLTSPDVVHAYVARANGYINLASEMQDYPRPVRAVNNG